MFAFVILYTVACHSDIPDTLVESRMVHLRDKEPREWSQFPESPDARLLEAAFKAGANDRQSTLSWRQQDVKQRWTVRLNGRHIAELTRDENDMIVYASIPPGTLVNGMNLLRVEAQPANQAPDDIRVGAIRVVHRPRDEFLNESILDVQVVDKQFGKPIPCRLTIVNGEGSLQSTGANSDHELAVRPGVVYTASGHARIGLPAGEYTVFAGRGFEYSLAERRITVEPGQSTSCDMQIQREVPTHGYVACDTHVHTLTHSGHGDATIAERLITLAGEGIELPVATDHNVHIDYSSLAQQMNLTQYFTPVVGNEVTTGVGHFNILPIRPGARVADHRSLDWNTIFGEIYSTPGVRIAILNHARDLHAGVRPFGPELFDAAAGEHRKGWPMRFNAMEVLNSSATQTDIHRLFLDWMSLLNRGYRVTPVGSSDSHDVARHFVGQGRTYIRCDDTDPGHIDVDDAVSSFLQGKVLVSYGLIVELTVDGKYRSGELVPQGDGPVTVNLRVLGPRWVRATHVTLYRNGSAIREQQLGDEPDRELPAGVQWQATWTLPRLEHDSHLVAMVLGDGIEQPFWKTAKAYQPTSQHWEPHTIACSGAVWIDADGDGQPTSAHEYADRLAAQSKGDLRGLMSLLQNYDQAIAAQAAYRLLTGGQSFESEQMQFALKTAAPHVQAGFRAIGQLNATNKFCDSPGRLDDGK